VYICLELYDLLGALQCHWLYHNTDSEIFVNCAGNQNTPSLVTV